VVSCRVLFDHNGLSKQVAFVQFEKQQQALDSIAALHNKEARGSKARCRSCQLDSSACHFVNKDHSGYLHRRKHISSLHCYSTA
jgi:RNA recognition motif-containing protein